MSITYEALKHKAQEISDQLTSKDGKEKDAVKNLKDLYGMGVQLAKAEASHKPLITDVLSEVMLILDEIAIDPKKQDRVLLHHSLCKVYRLFVELVWYRSWRLKNRPIWSENRDQMIEHADKLAKEVLKKSQPGVWELEFEYRTAEQAAKCLKPSENIWKNYIAPLLELIDAAKDQSIMGLWSGFRDLAKEAQKGWLKSWYLDVHVMRWQALRVTTIGDFKAIITPEISKCRENGERYAQCLAAIFMDIIKDKEKSDDLKSLAFRGDATQPGLIHIIEWEHQGTFQDYKNFPLEILRAMLRKADRFAKARFLAIDYLKKLAGLKKFKSFHKESLQSIQLRKEKLKDKERNPYLEEKKKLTTLINQLENRLQSTKNNKLKVVGKLGKFSEKLRSTEDEKEYQKLKEEKGKIEVEIGQLTEDAKKIEGQLEQIGQLITLQNEKDLEEQRYIESF